MRVRVKLLLCVERESAVDRMLLDSRKLSDYMTGRSLLVLSCLRQPESFQAKTTNQ